MVINVLEDPIIDPLRKKKLSQHVLLLSAGALPQDLDSDIESMALEQLSNNNETCNAQSAYQRSMLMYIECCLQNGADVNYSNAEGETAIMHACAKNDITLFNLLRKYKASLQCKDMHLNSLLHIAASCGAVETVELLLNAGADLLAQEKEQGRFPIHMAVPHPKVLKKMIAHMQQSPDCGLELCDNQGNTALHYSTSIYPNATSLRLLLDAKLDFLATNHHQKTALDLLSTTIAQSSAGLDLKYKVETFRQQCNQAANLAKQAFIQTCYQKTNDGTLQSLYPAEVIEKICTYVGSNDFANTVKANIQQNNKPI